MKINADIVNPFIEAGISVIKELTNIEVRRGHLTYRVTPAPAYEVSIIIGVFGFVTGQVVYSMKKEVAVRLVQRVLGDVSAKEMKELFVDTLGEVANMITGNATSLLNKRQDHSLTITTPAIVTGNQVSVRLVPTPTVVLGMYTPYGPIEINLCLEQQAGGV
jgi:chemotaxis protein CheX